MITVELPNSEAQRLLNEWEERAMQLEGELSDLQSAIASVKAQLNGKLIPVLPGTPPMPKSVLREILGTKKRKGQNLRTIQSFLETLSGRGVTTAEIVKSIGIGQSSVYAVLSKHPAIFAKGEDGLWRLKEK